MNLNWRWTCWMHKKRFIHFNIGKAISRIHDQLFVKKIAAMMLVPNLDFYAFHDAGNLELKTALILNENI